ncbi:hypothetical protein BRD00_13395 [Halobacteriales archaeon QS_8_69_26]|nr:MAG: hypothetical protein BRD00_13395 [Halobacteriales archaeon QS_8_69_26]
MSGSEPAADEDPHKITVSEQGITIEKLLAPDKFDTPAIVFTITSDRDSGAFVRITDPLPESIDPDDVGLHPEYDSEGWRRRGGDLQFEGRLDPGAQIETVYGLRVAEIDRPSSLLAEPTIDRLVDADDVDGEGEPDLDAEADEAAGDEGETEDLDPEPEGETEDPDPEPEGETEDPDPEPEEAAAAGGAAAGAAAADVPDTLDGEDSVAEALAAELQRGTVPPDTVETLNEHLDAELADHSEVKIDDFQSRLADLEAYTDALETILDRMGTDDDVTTALTEVRRDVEDVRSETESVSASVEDLQAELESTDAEVGSLNEEVGQLNGRVADLEDELLGIEDTLDTVAGVPEELDEFRASVEDDVESVRSDLQGEVDGVRGDVAEQVGELQSDVDERIEALESELDDHAETVRSDLTEELEALRAEVESLQDWRQTFVAAAAGGNTGTDDDE